MCVCFKTQICRRILFTNQETRHSNVLQLLHNIIMYSIHGLMRLTGNYISATLMEMLIVFLL